MRRTRDAGFQLSGLAFPDLGGGLAVSDRYDDEIRPRRRRKRRRHRRDRWEEEDAAAADDAYLSAGDEALRTPEEQVLERARRLADEKTELTTEGLWIVAVSLLLLVFVPPVGLFVLIFWGWKPAKRAYRLLVEDKLRAKFVEREVEKQVYAEIHRERRVLEGEHARSMQQLSASIAHEIRNPITAAKSLVQQMEEDPTSKVNVEYARVALEELQRVERSVSHLLRFARDEEMGLAEVPMAEVIDSALETFRDRFERDGVEVERRLDCEGSVRGDTEKLRRVIINLVGNALDALDEAHVSHPRLEISMGENLAGSEVWIAVRDNGPGIDEEAIAKLWSPFYTSKAHGTGLGLAISKKLIEAHGGTIEVSSQPGSGAEFLLTFPKAGRATQ